MMRGALWLALTLFWLPTFSKAHPPQRVVSLTPHATELLVAAGGRERLVAAVPSEQALPPGVTRLSPVGGIDREKILALRPDLVVAWTSGNRASDIAWLRSQNIPVYLSEPLDLQAVAADVRALGRRLGTAQAADAAARKFLEKSRSDCTDLPQQEVLVDIWDHPAMSVGGRHWLNDALSRVRLRNTFEDIDLPVFSVDRESLLRRSDLPVLRLRDGGPLGSRHLGRPGPLLAEGIRVLCEQRKQSLKQK